MYIRQGFNIRNIDANLEFQILEDKILGVHFNLAMQNELIPTIEDTYAW